MQAYLLLFVGLVVVFGLILYAADTFLVRLVNEACARQSVVADLLVGAFNTAGAAALETERRGYSLYLIKLPLALSLLGSAAEFAATQGSKRGIVSGWWNTAAVYASMLFTLANLVLKYMRMFALRQQANQYDFDPTNEGTFAVDVCGAYDHTADADDGDNADGESN